MFYQFLVGTDWHVRATKPAIRTDNFFLAQFKKLEYIFEKSREYQCPIFHNGDLFDVYDPPLWLVHEFIKLRNITNQPFYINPGNHDLYGASLKSLPQTALGLLIEAGVVRTPPYLVEEFLTCKALPYSLDFHPDQLQTGTNIVMTHSMITTRTGLPYEHFHIPTLATDADLVICGHWHSQFCVKHNETIFLNTGPLTRQTKTEAHIKPHVALVTVRGKKDIDIEFLSLPQVESPFDIKESEEEAPEQVGIAEQFLATISQNQVEMTDIFQLVKQVGEQGKFSSPTIVNATKTLQQVQNTWEE